MVVILCLKYKQYIKTSVFLLKISRLKNEESSSRT